MTPSTYSCLSIALVADDLYNISVRQQSLSLENLITYTGITDLFPHIPTQGKAQPT
jgi:hypothetical protein